MTLLASAFYGCSSSDTKKSGADFTLWTPIDVTSQAIGVTNYGDMMYFKELENRTGVSVEFLHPIQGSTGNEALVTLLADEVLPDMIEVNWTTYPGGPQAALDDDVLVRLDDYLEEFAPNYYKYVQNPEYKLDIMSKDGSYYAFNVLNIDDKRQFNGFFIRGDLLEKWGLSVPETIDEWTTVLARAKAEGYQYPLSLGVGPFSPTGTAGAFDTGFGFMRGIYAENGKITWGAMHPNYKAYLKQLADWYKAGYFSPGFKTADAATTDGDIVNDRSIVCWGGIGGTAGKLIPAGQKNIPGFKLVACPFPVPNKGDKPEYYGVTGEGDPRAIGITTSCNDIEKAVTWCDYVYSDEGTILHTFGIEGETFYTEDLPEGTEPHPVFGDKVYKYTDLITKHEGYNSVNEALWSRFFPANHAGLNQSNYYLDGFYPYQEQKDAIVMFNENNEVEKTHRIPTLAYTTDEANEIAELTSLAYAEFEKGFYAIITGERPLSDYDAILAKARKSGYDRILEIQQTVYDRMMKLANE